MRFMVMVRATAASEAGVMPKEEMFAAMLRYNEELMKAGVLVAAEGLLPSAQGARVRFSGPSRIVVEPPFAQPDELIAGYWIFRVASKDEAIAWVKRCPNPFDGESEIEIRRIAEADDLGEGFTPELREREDRLRGEAGAGGG